jgi:cation diffusion facilitator CzcD-associated flavoprotein CzcO
MQRQVHTNLDYQVAIVGTGFGGLCVAIGLKRAGMNSFVMLEKGDDVGGTWRDNQYPGCACDVRSHLYSFSFAPNPNWSRMYSPQPEIWQYLRHVTDKFLLRPFIRFKTAMTSARYQEESGTWLIETDHGAAIRVRSLVSAMGALSRPAVPDIPGLANFTGSVFHSQQWDHNVDLTGKRVAIIGTGASAIQIVPQIAAKVKQLHLFQRTPPWIIPRMDRVISRFEHKLFRWLPFTQRLYRHFIYWRMEIRVLGFTFKPDLLKATEELALKHMHSQITDPQLRARLTPDYRLGCKRVLVADDYFPALTRQNVALITDTIREITAKGIATKGGAKQEVDVIILATGFHVADKYFDVPIVGSGGVDIAQAWSARAEAYLGATTPGFPNFFMITGPNTGLGHTSMIFMIESQVNYIVGAIQYLQREAMQSLSLRPEVSRRFNDGIQGLLQKSVWGTGCRSWYLDRNGQNTTLWPGYTFKFRKLTRKFDSENYTAESSR